MGGKTLKGGGVYLCTNMLAGMFMTSRDPVEVDGEKWVANQWIKTEHYEPKPFDPTQDWNGRGIWLLRGGGWGDLIMMTPLMIELKRRWPNCILHVSIGEQFFGIFHGIDVIEELIPIDMNNWNPNDCVVAFEELIEGHPMAQKMHAADLFAWKFGIEIPDTRPHYSIKEEEAKLAAECYPRIPGVKRIGVQFMASCLARSYPLIEKVLESLLKSGYDVFIFGAPGQITKNVDAPKNLTNLCADNLTFRESAAVLKTCDSCISPDSAMVHLSSAIGVPCVALYGPFPGKLRASGSNMKIFEGRAPCAPCFFHARTATEFPTGMPCVEMGCCAAMASIDPVKVHIAAVSLASPIIQLDDHDRMRMLSK